MSSYHKTRAAVVVAAALTASVLLAVPNAQAGTATVTANFATGADYPLIKSKFGLFNSGYVSPSRWSRDAPCWRRSDQRGCGGN